MAIESWYQWFLAVSGRLVFRAAIETGKVDIVGINDPFIDLDYMVYMAKYDTVHGQFKHEVSTDGTNLIVDGKKIAVYAAMNPSEIGWKECGAEYVVESTGVFSQGKGTDHIDAGAKVVMSAPSRTTRRCS